MPPGRHRPSISIQKGETRVSGTRSALLSLRVEPFSERVIPGHRDVEGASHETVRSHGAFPGRPVSQSRVGGFTKNNGKARGRPLPVRGE